MCVYLWVSACMCLWEICVSKFHSCYLDARNACWFDECDVTGYRAVNTCVCVSVCVCVRACVDGKFVCKIFICVVQMRAKQLSLVCVVQHAMEL